MFYVETIPAPFATHAKRGTAALALGAPISRIYHDHVNLGRLHFCWQYHNAAFAREIADRFNSDPQLTAQDLEMNWRAADSTRFYTTSRTEF